MRKSFKVMLCFLPLVCLACTPKVKVEAPDKPIRIDMNVKIDHEVRVKVERDLEEVLTREKGLF